MNPCFRWFLALVFAGAGLTSCVSTLPSAEQLDAYQKTARAARQADYAELEQMRASGGMSEEDYRSAKADLDRRVLNQADTMAWNRHALAQSELKANSIPTPDQPIVLAAPGTGAIPNSMYNTPRSNAMTGQQSPNLGTSPAY